MKQQIFMSAYVHSIGIAAQRSRHVKYAKYNDLLLLFFRVVGCGNFSNILLDQCCEKVIVLGIGGVQKHGKFMY